MTKNFTNAALIVAAMGASSLCASAAQPNGTKHHKGSAPHQHEMEDAINSLADNAPADMGNCGTPNFVFKSKGSKFVLAVGGTIKTTVGMDWGHPISNADEFVTSEIPMQDMDGNGATFNASARQSSLYVNAVALPNTANEVGAFISFNLLNDYTPSLMFAYLRYRGFEAGYDYTLLSDVADMPNTIDYEGPNASTAIPTTGIRYGVNFGKKKNFKFSVGAEMPMYTFTTRPGYTKTVSQRVPDIPLALKYTFDGGDTWVRASGIIRNLYYRDLLTAHNIDKVGFGVQVDGVVKILPQLTGLFQAVYGKGIASYIQDLNGEGMDLMPAANGAGMKAIPAWGAFGALQYDFSSKVSSSIVYSHVRTYCKEYSGGDNAWGGQYRYGQYALANVMYNINSYFSTGIEYIWGRRVNYDGMKCGDNRLQAMVQFSF